MLQTKLKTIQFALTEAIELLIKTSDSPQLDAEILLCKVLAKDRAYLRTWPELEISDKQYQEFTALIAKRQQGQPIAYLTGVKEFWSHNFIVTPDVLIPRPETELLIELSLGLIPQDQPCEILDLGTGSGIIAITLAKERPNAEIIATDVSPAALEVAQQNASKHQAKNIRFIQSHWFDNVPAGKFDLIVSNPPYVAENDPHLQQGDLRFEPLSALISGDNGLEAIKHLAEKSRHWLVDSGYLLFEHGYDQGKAVQEIFNAFGYHHVETNHDLSGRPRVTFGRNLL